MQRLLLADIGRFVLDAAPRPLPGTGERLLRVDACALCRTDAKLWQQGHRDLVLPRVPGHEVCVHDPDTGARAVVWPGEACGHCRYCTGGQENLCPEMRILGFHRDGGLAAWLVAPASALIPLPPDLPADVATLAEPLACALNGLAQLHLCPGESLLVYGAGPLGLLVGYAAQAAGVKPFLVEPDAGKLAKSETFRTGLSLETGDSVPGRRFDAGLSAVSAVAAWSDGVRQLRPGGRFCLFSGLPPMGTSTGTVTALNEVHYRQLCVVGAYGCTRAQMQAAVSLLAARPERLAGLIEEHLTLAQVPETLPDLVAGRLLRCVVELRK